MRAPPRITDLDWNLSPPEAARRWPVDRPLMWLHSGRMHPRWARWSILASPAAVWRFDGRSRWVEPVGPLPPPLRPIQFTDDPLRDLDVVLSTTALDPGELERADVPFRGGWIGCISYDLGRTIEPHAQHSTPVVDAAASSTWPLIELAWCPDALVFDHLHQRWRSVEQATSTRWMESLIDSAPSTSDFHLGEFIADMSPSAYESLVARTIEFIAAGDIFQANIAQRFRAEFDGSSRGLAQLAFAQAQPWYGAYLELVGSGALLSLSPELFLQSNPLTRRVITRPIKGTRPIACDASELRDSTKDQAELNMIVDLMRNDLGRVCEYGSVRVPQPRVIETHPTVHHGVAEIAGRLRDCVGAGELLRATFPAGSVTGAPKIRAMQIIDELEPRPRGPYCGAIGFFSDCGTMTLNVAIRTLMLQGRHLEHRFDCLHEGQAIYFAGAGIVAESIPAREWQETLDKAAVMRNLARHAFSHIANHQ